MRTSTLLSASTFAVAALITVIGQAMTPPPPTSTNLGSSVVLTGWLHVDDREMNDVVLEVEVNGTVRTAHISSSGRFDIDLPAATSATLRFEKPGHVTKEVTVNTDNVQAGDFSAQRKRHVKLAVIMDPVRFMAGLTYVGPVGNLGFEEGGGCVAVAHTRTVEPAKRRAAMEF